MKYRGNPGFNSIIMFIGLLGCLLGLSPRAMAQAVLQIQSVLVDGQTISIQTDHPADASQAVNVLKLENPSRLVLDMPNTEIATPETSIPIHKDGVQRVDITESRSPIYNTARITVLVDDATVLEHMAAKQTNSGWLVSFNPADMLKWFKSDSAAASSSPTPNAFPMVAPIPDTELVPGPSGRTIVQDVIFQDGQLILKSNGLLKVKNRFQLKSPNRVVLDFDNAVLSRKSLVGVHTVANGNMLQYRVGQFDDTTVRLVIDAEAPQKIVVSHPEDKVLIVESNRPADKNTYEPVAAAKIDGVLQNIFLDNQNGSTVVRVITSAAMAQSVVKNDDTISITLDNISAVTGLIRFDRNQFPQIRKMWIDKNPTNNHSRINVALISSDVRMSNQLLSGNKALELSFLSTGGSPVPIVKIPGQVRVVIDPGHGGKDIGANRDNVYEKDLNLQVALRLRQALEARGVKVYMTRSTDEFLPLPEITRITNDVAPDLFVSVHTNSSVNPDVTGIETYFYTPQSIPLANRVHRQMVSNVNNSPDRAIRQARFYVIHHTQVPAILCEMGYISNAGERVSLQTDDRQRRTAEAIANGVVEYLQTRLTAQAK